MIVHFLGMLFGTLGVIWLVCVALTGSGYMIQMLVG